ncbi:MAG TPA: hypothetical protein VK524_10395 [Polyangiaceae bacterium]|nr:hypothetical protein [Polyangiaceae bacterium]
MANPSKRAAKRTRRAGLLAKWVTEGGMHVACYDLPLERIPADFFADPDGRWTYDALAQAAGLAAYEGVAVGALKEPFACHVEGAAVVTLNAESRPYVAIVECPIAYECVAAEDSLASSAA